MKKIFIFLFVLLMIAFGAGVWAYQQLQQFIYQPVQIQENQLLFVERGTTGKKLADLFEREKLITNAKWLPFALKLQPQLSNIKAGTYSLNGAKTLEDVLKILNIGKEAQLTIRFAEGETVKQVFNALKNAPHLVKNYNYEVHSKEFSRQVFADFSTTLAKFNQKSTPEQVQLEGWIYPDTYNYVPNSSDKELLQRAMSKMAQTLEKAWNARAEDLPLNNPYEMLILASIVEKESGVQAERARIASVFINRLKLKMRLQTDPTVIYGMGDAYEGNIRRKDLETPTAYNTYTIDGLPPTPIANPSESALMAVAQPETTDYLYFVADGTGGHKFSRTLAEHNRAVQEYLRWYRQNKSGK